MAQAKKNNAAKKPAAAPAKSAAPVSVKGKKYKNVPDKKTALKMYYDMLHIRRFEEKAGQLYGMGLIGGFCHLYIGQEAVVVGFTSVQEKKDTVITTYRDHGHMLACDMDPRGVMAELTGRATGYSRGKGGSMHMFSKEKGFYGGHGIVGASVALGTGLAFTHKYNEDGAVNLCYFGDGAAHQGQIYEVFNMAALWNLPVLYIIENNGYAMGTSVARHTAGQLHKRGEGYGIPGKIVDGMDVLAVRDAAVEALEYVRSGKGPMLLEVQTYRYRGHSMSDPAKYRTKEEVEEMRETRDPITNFKAWLLENNVAKPDELEKIEKDIKQLVKETEEFAITSPEPDVSELWTDILLDA
ncbi:MAG TPA: pyruvate dehydrogenase (acetyl-transferring) E1 component subunit alpha [Alphaproteobacteria bacterium]